MVAMVMPVVIALGFLQFARASASAFLSTKVDTPWDLPLSSEADEVLIMKDLEAALRTSRSRNTAMQVRLSQYKQLLSSTFQALPKNEHGLVGGPASRYALNRFFLQHHGWQVKGLEPRGKAWEDTSPLEIFEKSSPEVLGVLEQRFKSGIKLHELAAMAVAVEQLVYSEAMGRLNYTLKALEIPYTTRSLDVPETRRALETYMAGYILGANFSKMTHKMARKLRERIIDLYPTWPETQEFLRTVEEDVVQGGTQVSFQSMQGIIEEISEHHGRWQSGECTSLKDRLVELEDGNGTGRVRLADFYRTALEGGRWQFTESVPYLRQLGALDDSDPSSMKVIIPNYLYSLSNCIASSQYADSCCINECEDLMSALEAKLRGPDATPAEIMNAISLLPAPSGSAVAARKIPAAFRRRLDEIAEHDGGRVPLHGRLFAQWLHHLYPRECSYPHVHGITGPLGLNEFEEVTGKPVAADADEMEYFIETARGVASKKICEDDTCSGTWDMGEELVAEHRFSSGGTSSALVDALILLALGVVLVPAILLLAKDALLVLSQLGVKSSRIDCGSLADGKAPFQSI